MNTEQKENDMLIFSDEDEEVTSEEESSPSSSWKLLIVDDEEEVHKMTSLALQDFTINNLPLTILSAYSSQEALSLLKEHPDIAIILLDVVMETEHAGLHVVRTIREELGNNLIRIILRTGQPGVCPEKEVIECYDISDYKEKTELTYKKLYTCVYTSIKAYDALKRLTHLTNELQQSNQFLASENVKLKQEVYSLFTRESAIGNSLRWQEVLELVDQVSLTDSHVFLSGETGTGKELLARMIHYGSSRQDKPFICVNCASLSPDLLESELFGHRKGAFASTNYDRKGLFEEADGGTILLDEIPEISLKMQAKLLRAVQFGEIKPIGENKPRTVDVRIIAATNKNLAEEVKKGRFREDLYYRLAVFPIYLPPLRERREDIPLLAQMFLTRLTEKMGKEDIFFDEEVLEAMSKESFPGNIRELENNIERMVVFTPTKENINMEAYKRAKMFSRHYQENNTSGNDVSHIEFTEDFNLKEATHGFEKDIIQKAIRLSNGNKTKAAHLLRLPERTLFSKLAGNGHQK